MSVSTSSQGGVGGSSLSAAPASNIRVYVRVRPLSVREKESSGVGAAACLVAHPTRRTIEFQTKADARLPFTYDHVADEQATQEDVFQKVGKPITESCLAGYNGTILAYGQTGSGKTHTVCGSDSDRGLMPRVFEYLMASITREERKVMHHAVTGAPSKVTFQCSGSYLEVYNERIFDLLDASAPASHHGAGGVGSGSLHIREDVKRGVFVEGLTEEPLRSASECAELMARGAAARRVGETALNRESSRSHSVFTLSIRSTVTSSGRIVEKTSRFNLIDLAGSERAKLTGAEGKRMDEAKNINRSLSALGNVIRSLSSTIATSKKATTAGAANSMAHVPYRDSRLTYLLKDSLGGNSLTYLVACVSSAPSCFFESLSTLKFATMASTVTNCAVVNEDESKSMDALREENERLKGDVARMMAASQLGHRRMSMILPHSTSGYAGARDSCIGLLTPSRLRTGARASMSGVMGATSVAPLAEEFDPATADAAQLLTLVSASHARELAWQTEVDTMKEQLTIAERKVALDGMMRRVKESQLTIARQAAAAAADTAGLESNVDRLLQEENATLRQEIANLRSQGAEVTHAPSLVKARRELTILRDLLQTNGIEPTGATTNAAALEKAAPHRTEFELQKLLLSTQSHVTTLQESLAAAELKLEQSLDEVEIVHAARVDELEADLKAEKEMTAHLECQLLHSQSALSLQARESSESLLLSKGCLLRAEAERDDARRQMKELADKATRELQAKAREAQEESGISKKLIEELTSLQAQVDAFHAQTKTKDEALFQAAQEKAVLQMQKAAAAKDLADLQAQLAEKEVSLKQLTAESAVQQSELELQLSSLAAQLESSSSELASSTATVASLQSQQASLTEAHSLLQSTHDKLAFALDGLQDDHDTLSQEFEFHEGRGQEMEKQLTEANQATAAKQAAIDSAEAKLHAAQEMIAKVRLELEEARANKAYEQAYQDLLQEKTLVEAELVEARSQAVEADQHLLSTQSELSEANAAHVATRASLAAALGTVSDLRTAVQDLTARQSALSAEAAHLRASLADSSTSLRDTRHLLESVQTERNSLAEALDTRTEEMIDADQTVQRLGEERETLEQRLAISAEEKANTQRQLQDATSQLESAQQQVASLQSDLSATHATVSSLTGSKAALDSKLSSIASMAASIGAAKAADQTELDAVKQQLQAATADVDTLTKQLKEANQSATDARAALAALHSTMDGLDGIRAQREAEVAEARSQLTRAKADGAAAEHQLALLRQQATSHADRLRQVQSQLSAAQSELALTSQDSSIALSLQGEVQALQDRLSSGLREREAWMQEMESCRAEEARAVQERSESLAHLEAAKEALAKAHQRVDELAHANATLEETNAQLAGHQNTKQKIQLHQTIKRENDQLRVEKATLERQVKTFRRVHHWKAGEGAPPALEKELAQADEHIRAGEQAQIQLKALTERIAAIDAKVKASATDQATAGPHAAAVLGDITNGVPLSGVDSTSHGKVAAGVGVDSFPSCLSSLSSLSASWTRLSSQLAQSRREAHQLKNEQKLQRMKDELAHQKQHRQMQANEAGRPRTDASEEQENQ